MPSCLSFLIEQFKNEIGTEICAVLAFSAVRNNDKVGLILFTDKIEKYTDCGRYQRFIFEKL
jgi:hypothetical protein